MNDYRTHNCGELRIENKGQKVKLAGWVQRIRNLGGMKFIDLRDQYGITQIIISENEEIQKQAENLVNRMGTIFFLVPGYGAQGATADDVAVNFSPAGTGAIVNSSRGIMNAYKSNHWKDEYSEETWAEAARAEAIRATDEINEAIARLYYDDICVKL